VTATTPILVTGATGYIGARLVRRLENEGRQVRCLARRPGRLAGRVALTTEIVAGDLLAPESLGPAMRGVRVAYYLVHSMDSAGNFAELDRHAATNFARSARAAGLRHIVYLSGLGSGDGLSAHLASRHEVGSILRSSGVVTTELRSSIVIGAGSASFETVRAVVDQLPAIPAPTGLDTAAQPIAIEDLLDYLVAASSLTTRSVIFEIGGEDQVTYADVMREYAHQRKLRRRVVPLPRQTLRAARILLKALTPAHGRVAGAMADSLHHETVVSDSAARAAFPIQPRGLAEAIDRALRTEDHEFAEISWGDVLPLASRWGGTPVNRRLVSSHVVHVHGHPHEAFAPILRIGGTNGWYAADWFWRLRGSLDRLRGGDGMRRGRRDPHDLRVGDRVDFWRVERVEFGRRLLLAAEMKLPGRLWLQFEVNAGDHRVSIRLTTVFDPAGCVGRAYWYLLYPVHRAIFAAMLRGLRRVSEPDATAPVPPPSPPSAEGITTTTSSRRYGEGMAGGSVFSVESPPHKPVTPASGRIRHPSSTRSSP
jgi:uncharacterized protein YbjT (DUF2867 family)